MVLKTVRTALASEAWEPRACSRSAGPAEVTIA
jgi:hypothetical protein